MGRTAVLNGRPFTIIGILPEDVRIAAFGKADVWIPLAARASVGGGGRSGVLAIGRLRPGVTLESAQAELDAITPQIAREFTRYRPPPAVMRPLDVWLVGEMRGTFLMLLGAAVFLLLIVCANIAGLMLARGTARTREMAIRASLGAGRRRLAAQMMTESLLLATIGGLLGTVLAVAAVRAAPALTAIEIPRATEIAVDRDFLLIALGVTLASGFLFGLAPALQAWRRDLAASLHGGETAPGGMRGQRLREVLVAAQLALAMVLLSGAGLMANTMVRLLNVDLGFARPNVFTVRPSRLPLNREGSAAFLRDLAEAVRRIPGMGAASVANNAPLTEARGGYVLRHEQAGERRECPALGRDVDPGYFRVLAAPLLAGRDFEPADARRKPVPLILNRPAVRALFGSEDPLGRLVECTDRSVGTMRVIGVAGDVRLLGVTEPPGPQAYAPLMGGWGWAQLVVARASVPPAALAPAIRAAVRSLDPQSPPPEITTVDEVFSRQIAKPRFYATMLSLSAALGLLLASIGLYGVIAFTVARRTREFSIRLALGAEPGDVVRMVLASGARVVAAGVIAGLAGAYAATRLLSSLLFEVAPRDPFTFLATGILLVGVALLACRLAARRAMRVDLNLALRCE